MSTSKKKRKQKQENDYDALRRIRDARYDQWIKDGLVTAHQAHSFKTMEELILFSIVFEYIDGVHDHESIRRMHTFTDALFTSDQAAARHGEPSYLLDDDEEIAFVVTGLRCSTMHSDEKDTLSAIMLTQKRIFLFDSKKAEGSRAVLDPDSEIDPGHMVGALQAPLYDILDVTLKERTAVFPHGAIVFRVRMPKWLRAMAKAAIEIMRKRETDEAALASWNESAENFPDPMVYEIALRTEEAQANLVRLLHLLKSLGEENGFPVKNEMTEPTPADTGGGSIC